MTKVKVHNLNGTKDFEPKDGETFLAGVVGVEIRQNGNFVLQL